MCMLIDADLPGSMYSLRGPLVEIWFENLKFFFFGKYLLESIQNLKMLFVFKSKKKGVVLKVVFRFHGNQFKTTEFSRLKCERTILFHVPEFPKTPQFLPNSFNLFLRPGYTATRSYNKLQLSPHIWYMCISSQFINSILNVVNYAEAGEKTFCFKERCFIKALTL